MVYTKFQPNILSGSGEKDDFSGSVGWLVVLR